MCLRVCMCPRLCVRALACVSLCVCVCVLACLRVHAHLRVRARLCACARALAMYVRSRVKFLLSTKCNRFRRSYAKAESSRQSKSTLLDRTIGLILWLYFSVAPPPYPHSACQYPFQSSLSISYCTLAVGYLHVLSCRRRCVLSWNFCDY